LVSGVQANLCPHCKAHCLVSAPIKMVLNQVCVILL
jgi:hypothetical protein